MKKQDIVLYHFDALTGASLGQGERADRMLHGIKVGSGKLANAYLIDKAVLILDSSLQVPISTPFLSPLHPVRSFTNAGTCIP